LGVRSLSSRKTPKYGSNNSLSSNFLHCEFQLSMMSGSKVLFWENHFGELGPFPGGPLNLVRAIVSQISSYLVSFNFCVEQFKSFVLREAFLGFPIPQKIPKFGTNNCLINIFLHYKFQLIMFSSSKVAFRGGHFGGYPLGGTLNLIRIIV